MGALKEQNHHCHNKTLYFHLSIFIVIYLNFLEHGNVLQFHDKQSKITLVPLTSIQSEEHLVTLYCRS